MQFPVIKGGVTDGLASVGNTVKEAAIWTGHTLKVGFIKLGEAIKSIWKNALPFLRSFAVKSANFLRTPAGFILTGGALGVILAVTAETISHKSYAVALALKIAAIGAFIGMSIAIGVGITQGFLTPVV